MEKIYFYNSHPFLNYHHFPHQPPLYHNNYNCNRGYNGGICILVILIIIIVCILFYLFWVDKNQLRLYNKNTFASPEAIKKYKTFIDQPNKEYTPSKANNPSLDPSSFSNISKKHKQNMLSPDDFENI